MSTKKDNLKNLWDMGVYLLMDTEVGSEDDASSKMYGEIIELILQHNLSPSDVVALKLMICQRGGSVALCHSVVHAMLGSKLPIHTIVMGQASSAATHIAVAGTPKYRYCFKDSIYMIHTYSTSSWGKFHDLVAERKFQDTLRQFEIEHYYKCCKLSKKDVANKLLKETDTYLTSEEALSYGLVDKIIEPSYLIRDSLGKK